MTKPILIAWCWSGRKYDALCDLNKDVFVTGRHKMTVDCHYSAAFPVPEPG
jgi:hypothetical protein